MDNKQIITETEKYIFNTYTRFPLVLERGDDLLVWDVEGNEFLDFTSGLAVNNFGHCHPKIVNAIKNQVEKLAHISNFFYNLPQLELAKLLIKNSFADKVFFCNSGAEANEAAIKLARIYAYKNWGEKRHFIATMENSFHGRTLACITATGQKKFQKGFDPLVPGFKYIPFNDISVLRKENFEDFCAIMVEPIQGEGGVNSPSKEYLLELSRFCKENNILLIFDEIQVGLGRTGSLFAYENFGVEPDIMTLAKALGGGLPLGAMLAKEEISKVFTPGTHASTFGGNPVATAAGKAALEIILSEGILDNCKLQGKYFKEKLNELKEKYPNTVREVRGMGLILALELFNAGNTVVDECLKEKILINCIKERILRFLPPLTVKKEDIDRVISILDRIFKETQ
jgi:predicted acetylornithine/succinylornithine family transaminase